MKKEEISIHIIFRIRSFCILIPSDQLTLRKNIVKSQEAILTTLIESILIIKPLLKFVTNICIRSQGSNGLSYFYLRFQVQINLLK